MEKNLGWLNVLVLVAFVAGFLALVFHDLELALLSATIISGVVWLIYWLVNRDKTRTEPVLVEYARSFFPVLLIVLLLRSFVAEPFRIPSGSMLPTLEIGDFILVNKFAYGMRLPVFHTKVVPVGEPERGDVVVFRYPDNPRIDYIKRLIAVPGDLVEWDNKLLSVNGKPMMRTEVGEYLARDQRRQTHRTLRLTEAGESSEHDILIVPTAPGRSGQVVVPEGQYFVMGDNRDMSNDSRMWGLVPEGNLVGKAMLVWMHFDLGGDGVKFSRAGLIK